MSTDPLMREAVDRLRRIETRFTKYLESQGFDTKVRRPVFHKVAEQGVVDIPSPATALKDIITAVPGDWDVDDEITIVHKGEWMGSFYMVPPGTKGPDVPLSADSSDLRG